MSKYTKEEKLNFINECKENGSLYVSRKYGVGARYVRTLAARYRSNPDYLDKGEMHILVDPQIKINVVEAFISGKFSLSEIVNMFKLRSESDIYRWYDAYKYMGIEGLKSMKQGRQKKTYPTVKKIKDANDNRLKKLLSSDGPTSDEDVKFLKQVILRQQCESEVAKKFEALAQDLLTKKNSK